MLRKKQFSELSWVIFVCPSQIDWSEIVESDWLVGNCQVRLIGRKLSSICSANLVIYEHNKIYYRVVIHTNTTTYKVLLTKYKVGNKKDTCLQISLNDVNIVEINYFLFCIIMLFISVLEFLLYLRLFWTNRARGTFQRTLKRRIDSTATKYFRKIFAYQNWIII